MTTLAEFSTWIKNAILAWRVQTCSLIPKYPSDKRGPVFRFDAPCQVDVLHLLHLPHHLDFRLCIIRHFEDQPDLSIRVLGPYLPLAFPQALEDYVNSPFWDRPLPATGGYLGLWSQQRHTRYREALGDAIGNSYGFVRTYLNNTIRSEGIDGRSSGMTVLPGDCWSWGIAAEIEKSYPDAAVFIGEQIGRDLQVREPRVSTPAAELLPVKRSGLGAFLLPPVWIGDTPRQTLRERLEGGRPALAAHRVVVVSTSFGGMDLRVSQSGCFVLAIDDREKAAETLNGLFSMALFMDHSSMSVAPTDFVTMSNFDAPFTSYSYMDTLNPDQQDRLEGGQPLNYELRSDPLLTSPQVQAIIQAASELPRNPQRALVMKFALDAWSHLMKRDYRNALLSAWTGIELTIHSLRTGHLGQKGVTGQRGKRLGSRDAGRILEVLELEGTLPTDLIRRLDKTRALRNSVLHAGSALSPEAAKAAVTALIEVAVLAWRLPIPRCLCERLARRGKNANLA